MYGNTRAWFVATALGLSLMPPLVPVVDAQSTNATITSLVTDPSSAVIADARVSVVNTDTSARHECTTSSAGECALTNLPPGPYRIAVEKTGFKTLVKPGVTLHVQDVLGLELAMELGSVSETATVEAGAPLVDTASGSVSTVIDRTFVDNIPLNGRSFQTLITLTPGVVLMPTSFDDQGQFSVNGQRADANYFTVDGVSANFGVTGFLVMAQTAGGALPALSVSGGTNSLVSVDAMQEFRVQTSSFAPEFGRTPGAQVSIATRSGTNDFHGTAFEHFRTSALDARDWFVNTNRLSKPETRLNDFGGVIGGPLLRNRTFFFYSHEGLALRQPSTQQTAVPDEASRQQAIAAMRPYLNAYPVANGPALGRGMAQFSASYSNPSSLRADSVRVDHLARPGLSLFGRYNYSPSHLEERAPLLTTARVLSLQNSLSSTVYTLTGGVSQITGRLANDVRANYSNQRVRLNYALDNFGGALPLGDQGLFPPGFTSDNAALLFVISGPGQYAQGTFGTDQQPQLNLVDTLSISGGRHQMKAGVDYRRLYPLSRPFAYRQYVQFSGLTAAPGGALSGVSEVATAGAFNANALRSQNFSLFAQDAWRITPRLTVTYGLRWDVNPPLTGKDEDNDPFTVVGLDHPATLALAPRGTPLYETRFGNVAPRFGVAYQLGSNPRWGATLRGGAGVFYDLGNGSLGGTTTYFPYFANKTVPAAVFPLSAQDSAPPPFTLQPPVSTIVVADPHLRLPRSYQWNAAIEQSLGSLQSVSVTYIGALGRDLLRVTNLFNVNPDFLFVSLTDNSATSEYHALQVRFQRRLSGGVQGMVSYSLAHSQDNASSDALAHYLNTPDAFSGPNADYGDSDFDIRHVFTTGLTFAVPAAGTSPLMRGLTEGWSLDAFALARSAPPLNVVGGFFAASGTALYPRPNVNAGVPLEVTGPQYPGGKTLNGAAFSTPPPGQQGNFGRNVLRGFGAWQADLAVQRELRVTPAVGLRLRAEFFNIFNHPNFGSPNVDLTSPLFGRATQTLANSLGSGGANGGFSPLYQVGGPRSIQLVARFQF